MVGRKGFVLSWKLITTGSITQTDATLRVRRGACHLILLLHIVEHFFLLLQDILLGTYRRRTGQIALYTH